MAWRGVITQQRRLCLQAELRIMEEPGSGRLMVRGLREEFVETPGQALRLLSRGIAARRTAETRLNATSSRSHSIFTLCTHVKEEAANGDDLIKLGKLNLVDLAGSENVSRSGARDMRAREAGSINQSLLTLGRVINALVDGGHHVPYRCGPPLPPSCPLRLSQPHRHRLLRRKAPRDQEVTQISGPQNGGAHAVDGLTLSTTTPQGEPLRTSPHVAAPGCGTHSAWRLDVPSRQLARDSCATFGSYLLGFGPEFPRGFYSALVGQVGVCWKDCQASAPCWNPLCSHCAPCRPPPAAGCCHAQWTSCAGHPRVSVHGYNGGSAW